jgi:hypothetical protein
LRDEQGGDAVSDSAALIQALKESGLTPRSYSGRGMYGKECVGFEDRNGVGLWEFARHLDPDLELREPHSDQLGKGMIYYWPEYAWPEGEEE